MKNITFLLGAGASYNSLPVVQGMDKRMELFVSYLVFNQAKFSKKINNYEKLLDTIKSIIKNAKPHASIDTYAKKLFLRNNEIDAQNLLSLKWLLSCYFVFEQGPINQKKEFIARYFNTTIKDNIIHPNSETNLIIEKNKLLNNLAIEVDNRYDVFLATLLQKTSNGSLELPEEVNIISWNYDYQLELAFMGYLINPNYMQSNIGLKTYPNTNPKSISYPKFIKLNGTASYFERLSVDINKTAKNQNNMIHIRDENDSHITSNRLLDLLSDYSEFLNYPKSKFPIIPYINFAWEKDTNKISESAFEYAKEIMKKTDTVVVIGYSFPNFNRLIDKEIFRAGVNSIKHIYYQSPDADKLLGRFDHVYPYKVKPTPIKEVDQFYIPL